MLYKSNSNWNIERGLDFILSHFQEPIFPRKIMTKDLGYQLEVFNKEETLSYFKNSRYEDCRINAYPSFTDYQGINRTPISFLMVDLDLKDFVNKEKLRKSLYKTLDKIRKSIGGNPTVLWTGNGYHIYQPVSRLLLEEYETFYEFTKCLDKDLTSLFIQFAEEYFTNKASDSLHHPTVKSCLLRIPGSINSKCIIKAQDTQIRIVQGWSGQKPSIIPLLRDFRRWLIQKRIDVLEELKKQEKRYNRFQITTSQIQEDNNDQSNKKIRWIDNGILEDPLPDFRKYILWRILAPYLLNIKKLSKEESFSIMKDWLDKCNKLKELDFNPMLKIKDSIKGASKGYYPISLEKLKEENGELYNIVTNRLS